MRVATLEAISALQAHRRFVVIVVARAVEQQEQAEELAQMLYDLGQRGIVRTRSGVRVGESTIEVVLPRSHSLRALLPDFLVLTGAVALEETALPACEVVRAVGEADEADAERIRDRWAETLSPKLLGPE